MTILLKKKFFMVICFTYFHLRLSSAFYSILKLLFDTPDTISYKKTNMQVDCLTPVVSSHNSHDSNVGFTVAKGCLIL